MTELSQLKKQQTEILRKALAPDMHNLIDEIVEDLIMASMEYTAGRTQKNVTQGFEAGVKAGQKDAVSMFGAVLKTNGGTLKVTQADLREVSSREYEVQADTDPADGSLIYTLIEPPEESV